MQIGQFGMPGVSAAAFTSDREILWGGDDSRIEVLQKDETIESTTADAGNTPTTVVRKGLIFGRLTSTGFCLPWNPDAVDGTENIVGVNNKELVMIDFQGVACQRFQPIVIKAPVQAGALLIQGSALVGHVDEYLARRLMVLQGFRFDDDVSNFKSGVAPRQSVKATNYTVVAADNGTAFHAITADATFTLPTIQAGLAFEFLRASDHEMVIASAEGDNMICGGDLSADNFTFTTAGQQIGARVRVQGIYLNGTLKWLVEVSVVPYSTGALMASAFTS